MNENHRLRICVGASAGGHLTQLLRLVASWEGHSAFYVSTLPVVAGRLQQLGPTYIIGECNRRHPLQAIGVLFRAFALIIRERPDVVLTTGSLPLALVCAAGKLFGSKIIWIDSITNIEALSMSGRMVRLFANLFLVQWADLAHKYGGVEYVGGTV